MLFKTTKRNPNIADGLIRQMSDNTELIDELLSQQYELNGFKNEIGKDLFDIVASQQSAIRSLQESVMALQSQKNSKGTAK